MGVHRRRRDVRRARVAAAGSESAGNTIPDVIETVRAGCWWSHGCGRTATGAVVSLAGRHAPAVGVARVASVYTPPENRRRGCGAAVTAACTSDALCCGAQQVVLFTDLANPTSKALSANRIPVGQRPHNRPTRTLRARCCQSSSQRQCSMMRGNSCCTCLAHFAERC